MKDHILATKNNVEAFIVKAKGSLAASRAGRRTKNAGLWMDGIKRALMSMKEEIVPIRQKMEELDRHLPSLIYDLDEDAKAKAKKATDWKKFQHCMMAARHIENLSPHIAERVGAREQRRQQDSTCERSSFAILC